MEWPYVVVLGAHDGLMPHALADDIEEERRIFHVAITRGDTAVQVIADVTARRPFLDELLHTRAPVPARPERPERASVPAAPGRGRRTLDAELGLARRASPDRPDGSWNSVSTPRCWKKRVAPES